MCIKIFNNNRFKPSFIYISKGMNNFEKDGVESYESFDSMNLPDELLRGVYAFGFEKPSEIQKHGIVPICKGNDVLAQAQSGTGKTGTFAIGALSRVDPSLNEVQVLVLCPTHELAEQIHETFVGIGRYLNIKSHYVIGGRPIRNDIQAIQNGCHVLVGTPGRVYDLCNRGVLKRTFIRNLIMDEADVMLEDRFREQVVYILQMGFPSDTRVVLFSATMTQEFIKFADSILQNPVSIRVSNKEVPLEGIKQYYIPLEQEEWKFETLCDIYSQLKINQAMIFCNKQSRADWLSTKMKNAMFTLECLHGGMSQEERQKRMDEFRSGSCRILITTDLTARGIDVQQVSTVINYDIPNDKANYIHRIGRAGRYGRKGITINFVSPNEATQAREIQTYWSTDWSMLPEDLSKVIM
jgi:translation initiation factor 4A